MKSPTTPSTVRRSVALPAGLVEEARRVAPEELRGNFNRLVQEALREYISRREARAFADSMAAMARDPAIAYECRELDEGLRSADLDDLGDET